MKFVPAGTNGILFCIWDVRVKDFTAFVNATGYDATGGMYSVTNGDWGQRGATWRNPGFSQTEQEPVVGVSWNDAKAFCTWLTLEDRKQGIITANQSYRLPLDAEWSRAVGLEEGSNITPETKDSKIQGQYPWGNSWPPPLGAGNYAGNEAKNENWPLSWGILDKYRDDYPRTSPVGSFEANSYGLYDMGGNVWQFCEDYYNGKDGKKVLRGGSWGDSSPVRLASSFRNKVALSGYRDDCLGFRVVLVVGPTK